MNTNETPTYSMETDPLFQPISEDKKKLIDKAVEKKISSLSLDDNVDKDTVKVPGQNYALISIVSPQSNQKSEQCCLKVRGTFNTLEDANKQAELLQKIDSTFDVYVVEMYSWLLIPPDPEQIEQKHIDSKLNEIIGGHRESQMKSKMYFEERKRELMENISIENEQQQEKNEQQQKEEEEKLVDITESTTTTEVSAESSIHITDNVPDGNYCPNSSPSTESTQPSDLMKSMLNEPVKENPSKLWADSVD